MAFAQLRDFTQAARAVDVRPRANVISWGSWLAGCIGYTRTMVKPATPSSGSKSSSCVTTGSPLEAAIAAIQRSLMRTR